MQFVCLFGITDHAIIFKNEMFNSVKKKKKNKEYVMEETVREYPFRKSKSLSLVYLNN